MTFLRARKFPLAALAVAVVLLTGYSSPTEATAASRHVLHVVTPRGLVLRSSQNSICERVCLLFRRECVAGCNELPLVGGSDHIRYVRPPIWELSV